jgi:hypothetical protein
MSESPVSTSISSPPRALRPEALARVLGRELDNVVPLVRARTPEAPVVRLDLLAGLEDAAPESEAPVAERPCALIGRVGVASR